VIRANHVLAHGPPDGKEGGRIVIAFNRHSMDVWAWKLATGVATAAAAKEKEEEEK